tara:strand:+ start:261 stop:548 length:288 start_codon:yes stop_codon:yes gene_type:complete
MELKLSSGKKVKIKNLTLDERDELLDSVKYEFDDKGNPLGMTMMNKTITKWLRTGLDGDISDDAILKYSFKERVEIFTKMQDKVFLGEMKASASK